MLRTSLNIENGSAFYNGLEFFTEMYPTSIVFLSHFDNIYVKIHDLSSASISDAFFINLEFPFKIHHENMPI